MEMTAPCLCERLSHRGHVNDKEILPETPIRQSYLIQLTNVEYAKTFRYQDHQTEFFSICEGCLHTEIDAAVEELIVILNFQRHSN